MLQITRRGMTHFRLSRRTDPSGQRLLTATLQYSPMSVCCRGETRNSKNGLFTKGPSSGCDAAGAPIGLAELRLPFATHQILAPVLSMRACVCGCLRQRVGTKVWRMDGLAGCWRCLSVSPSLSHRETSPVQSSPASPRKPYELTYMIWTLPYPSLVSPTRPYSSVQ